MGTLASCKRSNTCNQGPALVQPAQAHALTPYPQHTPHHCQTPCSPFPPPPSALFSPPHLSKALVPLQGVAAAALHGDGAARDGGPRQEVGGGGGVPLHIRLTRGLVPEGGEGWRGNGGAREARGLRGMARAAQQAASVQDARAACVQQCWKGDQGGGVGRTLGLAQNKPSPFKQHNLNTPCLLLPPPPPPLPPPPPHTLTTLRLSSPHRPLPPPPPPHHPTPTHVCPEGMRMCCSPSSCSTTTPNRSISFTVMST